MQEDLFSKSFDHLIAFVLPGLVALWGLSYFDPSGLGEWFARAPASDTSLGAFLFLVLAALALGLFISGLRWLIFEKLLKLFPAPPLLDDAKRKDAGILQALADARHSHYYFHLFYANNLCALPFTYVGWLYAERAVWYIHLLVLCGLVAVELVLFFCARQSIDRYKTKAEGILGVINGGRSGNDERRLA